jgi:sarcosine oxidase
VKGIAAARQHAIPFEVLDPAEIHKRFPAITPQPRDVAVHELRAGFLAPEACIEAHLQMAQRHGAHLHFDEKVISWKAAPNHVEVSTPSGVYSAQHLVIAAGPWAANALGTLLPLRVTRQVMAWISPSGGIQSFVAPRFPVFLSECPEDARPAYGFPAIDGPSGGVKAAIHGSRNECTPATIDRTIHDADLQQLKDKLARRIPALNGEVLKAQTCLYTMTPDEHFVLGRHPNHPAVSLACGFSGHGFKFASVVGEVLADLAIDGATRHPIGMFSPGRFAGALHQKR